MRRLAIQTPRPRLRYYLAAVYGLFIVYASLSPFTGWQAQGLDFASVLRAPLAQTYTAFDTVVNGLAYWPLGMLFGLALRPHLRGAASVVLATCGGLALSVGMEYAQLYLPSRISSNVDILANTAGALLGAMIGASIAAQRWFAEQRERRTQFFNQSGMDYGLALLALWVFAQVNPSLPMLGTVFIGEVAHGPFMPPPAEPFNPAESLVVVLNLLMLGILLLTLLRERRHALGSLMLVLGGVALIKFVAAAVLLKSWALLLWLNADAMVGGLIGLLVLAVALWLPGRALLTLAAGVTLAYLVVTHGLLDPSLPAAARPLYQWHYVHLLNYNGLTQTVTLLFPFLFLGYLWRIRRAV